MTKLNQRYFLSRKTFELLPDKVVVKERSVFDEKEWEARFDQIGLDLIKIKSREGIGNAILFGGLLVVSGVMTFDAFTEEGTDIKLAFLLLFFCFMWATVFWWSIQKYFAAHFILSGGSKTLMFFINSPAEEEVKAFIETIRGKVRNKLKSEIAFDPDLTLNEQLDHLKYLKRIDVLTHDEYESLREVLREKHLLK